MKCISIDPIMISQLEANEETWYCYKCLAEIFPYNNIDCDDEFILITTESSSPALLSYLSDKLFLPL